MHFNTIENWVKESAQLTSPASVKWCDGSQQEYDHIIATMLKDGSLLSLNDKYRNCYLHRSHPSDVARTEQQTFVCPRDRDDAGPNNNWLDPQQAHAKVDALFRNCMQGRTMYVIPYCMGPIDSPYARLGMEITDSPYVVANMRIMTRMGEQALARIKRGEAEVVRGLHSVADLDPQKRFIMHFPEELLIKSVGSGYGGNALLGKKCHALRIASSQARRQGWLAEHMLIAGIEHRGETHYVAAAFPSACGKTNLAMLIPPDKYRQDYKVWTVGDDIAWIHVGDDGRLWAINPEAGFFGVVPGTNEHSNPNALSMIDHDTIYTNVALTADKEPWWEGKLSGKPHTNWKGEPHRGDAPAAHPNARFTVASKQCPSYSPAAEGKQGVPLSAIIFGGRRSTLNPLVVEAFDWSHGVYMGATLSSETTAAATGKVGVVRRDPMAMLPFCGYNMGDYWSHWLSLQQQATQLPRIFQVNWFRCDDSGKFLWPGFGDNLRVLQWVLNRCRNEVDAVNTPIGYLPNATDIDCEGLDVSDATKRELFAIDRQGWQDELTAIASYFSTFGTHVPPAFAAQAQRIRTQLDNS